MQSKRVPGKIADGMADFSLPAPYEPQKVDELHRGEAKPKPPRLPIPQLLRAHATIILGTALGLGFVALAFEARASWGSHRDWVVPVTVPFWALAGVAMASLLLRRRWAEAAAGLALLAVVLALTAVDVWAAYSGGSDALRDALAILTGVALGAMVVAAVAGYVWSELRAGPPPAPEA